MKLSWRESAGILVAAGAMVLAGCGGSSSSLTRIPVTPAAQPGGEVFGGQQPITGMTLQLYDAGGSGYGSAATGLLTGTLPVTDSNGKFSFANPTCPNGSDQVYLVGTGGDPVAGNASNGNSTAANLNLALMVALGNCSGLNSISHIHMNELTTVAAVWALAPFMSGNTESYKNVGTSSTNAAGLQLAFAAAGQVANISNGTLPGTLPAGATLQSAEVNTIADALEACINSKGGTAGDSSSCGNLFAAASSRSGSPTDTITAAMNIAQNPAQNVASLDSVVSNTSTFQPIVASPTAFTIAIEYTGGGLDHPTAIAADQAGQIWVANSGTSNAVSLFDNLGNSKLLTTGTVIGGTPEGVAIDLSGNAWVTASNNDVYELDAGTGLIDPATPFTGFNAPTGIAVDPAGYIWVVDSGNSKVSAFNSSNTPLSGSPFSGAGISAPAGIAINGNANANCADCH
jgi:hypothetical protein